MKINTQITVLDSIEIMGAKIKLMDEPDQRFSDRLDLLKNDLRLVKDYLDCNESQALLFSAVFFLNLLDGSCSLNQIGEFLKCSPFEMIRLEPELQELYKRKQVIKSSHENRRRNGFFYHVPDELVELVSKDKKPEPLDEKTGLFEVADLLHNTLLSFRNNDILIDQIHEEINFFKDRYSDLGVFKLLNQLNLNKNEVLIFINVFVDTCMGEESVDLQYGLNKYILKIQHRVALGKLFLLGKAELIVSGTLEFDDTTFRTDRYVKFTQKAFDQIFGDEKDLFEKKVFNAGPCDLIEYSSIKHKELYYEPDECKELNMFEEILKPEKYKKVVDRLADKKLPVGVTAILHGYPGTGKTESVFQLARKSKRNILMVDISKIRDKFVGESEKKLKEVFNVYRKALKHFDEVPILLFNESDALISKRINVTQSSDQMNNSMQNILLQEMEGFSGIMMATTNLINNLDPAFERRFLFKIKFGKPSIDARVCIWADRVNTLNGDEALQLATNYDFSGGQIDNITKKILMSSLLSDKPCNIDDIIEYCDNELFIKKNQKRKIGF